MIKGRGCPEIDCTETYAHCYMSSPFFGSLSSLLRVSSCLVIWPSNVCWIASCSIPLIADAHHLSEGTSHCLRFYAFAHPPTEESMMAAFSIPQFRSSVPNVALYLSDVLAHASMFLTPFATSSYMRGLFIRLRLCLVFCLSNKNHWGPYPY